MRKVITGCCAMCQLDQVNNTTPIADIKATLVELTAQMKANVEVGITTGNGQTAVFTIVSPGEVVLERNLITLGFKLRHMFSRRKGYPETGQLKMYIKNL